MWYHSMKPRDVAIKMGLSRRTVYEAARKFRKAVDEAIDEDKSYSKKLDQQNRRDEKK